MDIRKLQRAIVDGLEDVKAQNIVVLNTEHLSPLFERVIIASGTSNRQTKALAASVRDSVKSRGMPVMATEGEDNGEWIIVDCGAAVAHIMQPSIRDYYHLEEIWGGKPVRMKVGDTQVKLVKASEPAAARKPAGKGSTRATGKPAPKPASRPASKAAPKPARKATAGPSAKAAPARAAGAKPAPRRQAAGPGAANRTAAGQGAAAKRAPARKTAAGKPVAKTPARKTPRAR